jgi:tripartite-type tricarboxylate transporter receptor subunit TctC
MKRIKTVYLSSIFPRKFLLLSTVIMSVFGGLSVNSWAQEFPNRPIKFVVPLAPGGATDTVTRIVAKQVSQILNNPVIVENRIGAGGLIAMESMTKVAPDGYTLFVGNLSTNALNQTVFEKKMKFKPEDELTGISILATIPHILVSSAKFEPKTFAEAITFIKNNPQKVNHASPGVGSYSMIDMVSLEKAAGLNMTHVPYNGGVGQFLIPMISNDVQIAFINASSVIEMIRAGNLRALAVTTDKRLTELPNTPTMSEVGYPGIGTNAWQGLFAPKKTPPAVVAKIHAAVVEALKSEEVKDAFKKQLIIPVSSNSPEDFNLFLKSEVARWANIVKSIQLQVD